MTPTATAEKVIVYLPVDSIENHPDNIRADVGDVLELAQTITTMGMRTPLIVLPPSDDDVHLVVAGNRRLAAARVAGLAEVPCIVEDLKTEEILELMLVENCQRVGLTPVEEGRAFARLASECGYTVADIARKVGTSVPTVRSRLDLVMLPPAVLARFGNGLNLADATTLAGWAHDAEVMAHVAALPAKACKNLAQELDRFVTDRSREQAMTAARRDLDEAGLVEIRYANSWERPSNVFTPHRASVTVASFGELPDGVDHADEECHVVYLQPQRVPGTALDWEVERIGVCIAPARHTTLTLDNGVTRSGLQVPEELYADFVATADEDAQADAALARDRAERAALAKAAKEAAESRYSFLLTAIADNRFTPMPPMVARTLITWTMDAGDPDRAAIGDLVVPDATHPDADWEANDEILRTWEAAAADGTDPELQQRWAWAIVALDAEHRRTFPGDADRDLWCDHVQHLIDLGYEPTAYELDVLDENRRDRERRAARTPVHTGIDVDELYLDEDLADVLDELEPTTTDFLLPAGSVPADMEARGWADVSDAGPAEPGLVRIRLTGSGRQVLAAVHAAKPPWTEPELDLDTPDEPGPDPDGENLPPAAELPSCDADRPLDRCMDLDCTEVLPGDGGAHKRAKEAGWGRKRRPDGDGVGFVCPAHKTRTTAA
jgi:ParB/RepB/Spo0J family partition protein